MDPVTISLGLFGLGFGGVTTFVRFTHPEKLGKLGPMREKFGTTAGTAIHVVAYSVAPILFGITMLTAGVRGVAVF